MKIVRQSFAYSQALARACSTSRIFVGDGRIVLESSQNTEDFDMTDKPRLIAVTDPDEADALTSKDEGDLSTPFTMKPNGHLWVDRDELRAWRLRNTSGADK